jgi:hypothetical protein
MDNDSLRSAVLEAFEASLAAQLKAIRSLRSRKSSGSTEEHSPGTSRRRKGLSQIDMAFDILLSAGCPLHITALIERIAAKFGTTVDRESLVSALSKRVNRRDRFTRTDKNTFALLAADSPRP